MKLAPAFLMVSFWRFARMPRLTSLRHHPAVHLPPIKLRLRIKRKPNAPAPAPAQSSTDATPDVKSTTIRGCLEGGTDRGYTLTDNNGTRYALTGTNVNALISHVGEEVDLDGEPAPGSDVSGTGSATTGSATDKPAAAPSQTFKVSDVRKVSDKCAM